MKLRFICRTAALALLAFLALALALSLSEPGYAADGGNEVTLDLSKGGNGESTELDLVLWEGQEATLNVVAAEGFQYLKEVTNSDAGTAEVTVTELTGQQIVNPVKIKITAKSAGKAKITVKLEDHQVFEKTVVCNVTVKEKVAAPSVTLKRGGKEVSALDLKVGDTAELTVEVSPANATYGSITCTSSNISVATATVSADGKTVTVKAVGGGSAKITVAVSKDGKEIAKCVVTVTVTVPVESVALKRDGAEVATLDLWVGQEVDLTVEVSPGNATNKDITCSSGNINVATATVSKDSKTVTVKAVAAGETTITVTTVDGRKTAVCKVNVKPESPQLIINGLALWTSKTEDKDKGLVVELAGLDESDVYITWTARLVTVQPGMVAPTFTGFDKAGKEITGKTLTAYGLGITINEQTAGEFIIRAAYTDANGNPYKGTDGEEIAAEVQLTISGIVISGPLLDAEKKTVDMIVNGSSILAAAAFGDAASNGEPVRWRSNDDNVVSVMPNGGNLNAWNPGKTEVIATKGEYRAMCTVTVDEDKSVIASGYKVISGEPIDFWNSGIYAKLEEICRTKTAALNGDGTSEELKYITNLQVVPEQGTLYCNYSTESDTGSGVGYTYQFARTASGSIRSIKSLSFVSKPGFSGTAEITFTGVSGSRNFTGLIRIEVGSGSGVYQISYQALAGEPVWFRSADFESYCQSVNDRGYNYITFNLPKSGEGVLYHNYVAGSGIPVTPDTRFTASGRYTLDDVCFVPNAAFQGKSVTVSFRGTDTSGKAVSGELTVNVIQPSADDDHANVTVSGERGRPVALQSSLFNDACQEVLGDVLSFVTFKLPDQNEGTLYYNYWSDKFYDSRVAASTRYYYSGVPGLSGVSFVPANNAAGRVAISYTAHGVGGASFSGTLYVVLEDVDRSVIYYSVPKGGSVTFTTADFNTAAQQKVGSSVSFVVFTGISYGEYSGDLGTLRYKLSNTSNPQITPTTNVTSNTAYFLNPTGSQRGLSKVYFEAKNTSGTVTISYTAYSGSTSSSSRQKLFDGKVVVRVGSQAPDNVNLFCDAGRQAQLTVSAVNNACSSVMSGSLSYIEITSVPGPEAGRLYFDYSRFGTGTAVEPGDRFYRLGSSNIGQLTFVPFARFSGEAEITYIGYSADGKEQVSGRIVVSVTKSTKSQYFDDIRDYTWAVDSVDYLRRNETVLGVGGRSYDPGGMVKRGDFVLMLVRAYGLTATGSAYFSDVPDDSYYADAIRVAAVLGVANGSNGRFNPQDALTRQDAMVMIYNTLKVCGKTTTNGLAADLSAYHDGGEIATYAREAMGNLIQMGVVTGDGNGYLRPQSRLNRAEAAVLLHTIMTL